MKSNAVSIVIPCKNAEPWIGDAIESCLAQTWKRIEILVVDNGSSDRSRSIASSYKARGVRVFNCDILGASASRNVGLREASGDYVQFLDADDVIAANKIEAQLRRLSREGPLASAICKWATFTDAVENCVSVDDTVFRDHDPIELLVELWMTRTMMAPFAWLTSREVIERAGLWSEGLSWDDDGEFFSRVAMASERIVHCEGAFGFYRRTTPHSMSKRRDVKAMQSAFLACEMSTRTLLVREESQRTRQAAAAKYLYFVHLAYPIVPSLVREAERRIKVLGGLVIAPSGSKKVSVLSRLVGWKLARRAQFMWIKFKRLYVYSRDRHQPKIAKF